MVKNREISDSDSKLFRDTIGNVTEIRNNTVVLESGRSAPLTKQDTAAENGLIQEFNDYLCFKRTGLQHRVFEKLRRGQITIEKELDLHGMTVSNAQTAVKVFLTFCLQQKLRYIKIIHGKGLGSSDRLPVLKTNLNQWLQKNNSVLAFCSARPADGGTGAVYVLLKIKK